MRRLLNGRPFHHPRRTISPGNFQAFTAVHTSTAFPVPRGIFCLNIFRRRTRLATRTEFMTRMATVADTVTHGSRGNNGSRGLFGGGNQGHSEEVFPQRVYITGM